MSITLILHQLAEQFAEDASQREILDAVVFEDERSFSRILLEESTKHDILLGGDFGVCLWGLLIIQGTREMWRDLNDLGYDGHTHLWYQHNALDEPSSNIAGLAQMTVSGASMVLCDVDRFKQIQSWFSEDVITTKAFANGSVSSIAFGLVHGDDHLFEYLTKVWQGALEEGASNIFYTKKIPHDHAKILEYTSFELINDSENEKKQQRMGVLLHTFMQAVYEKTLPWQELIERLPNFGQAATSVYIDYTLSQTPEEEKWLHNHALFLGRMENYTGMSVLLQRSPFEHVIDAGQYLISQFQKAQFNIGSGQRHVWQSFIERLEQDAPSILADMPVSYRKGEFVSKESSAEKTTLWFETFSFDQPKKKTLQKKM